MTNRPEVSTNQSNDCEILLISDEDAEQSQFFTNVATLIEKDLADMKDINEHVSKMREKVAHLEWELLSKVASSTWRDVSELIGLSCATVIQECFNILDHDGDKSS